ncbi:Ring finger domain/RING-H2 zinc finger/Zinc finger C3HC4 type (RING finger) containing protein [Leishmania donovani]|uniref:Ring finger domain family protein n=1 Tax=Leishmania donovani TaxID=5661 RepID=A0A504XZR0_LEIDO|nr:Ring finger domain family protein [Leishmania donovani]CAJ1988625.1 Ring finger domain/RING-H2 zinc finger/Zinc finger C3HC4 type (RING finger) containing protein [Leishmania donovani]VDZ44505.1 Ring_finger_domain/RING-H2_zinc_finger/Zinc_finger_C3HC4_type_(RING_finger)_containing_protein_putative/Pfam:PF13639/Pfam:PF12678/Pfam:PF00097 [Leishmania donovani]
MFPSGFPSSAAGSGNNTAGATAPHMHVHTVVINVGDTDGTAVGGNAGVADVFSGVPATVSAVMTAAMDLSDLPGLIDLLSDTTPASTAAREWHAESCPPFSPEEVISTFDVVQPPLSSPVTATASTSRRETDGADTAASPSPPAPEAKECAICLEPLFRTSVVRSAPESGESMPNSAPPLSELSTADREKPATASQSPSLQSQAPSSPPSVPPPDAAASSDATRPLAHDDTAEAAKDAKTVREVYCGHRFHESCILRWITLGHYSCPLCRSPFVFE